MSIRKRDARHGCLLQKTAAEVFNMLVAVMGLDESTKKELGWKEVA